MKLIKLLFSVFIFFCKISFIFHKRALINVNFKVECLSFTCVVNWSSGKEQSHHLKAVVELLRHKVQANV